MFVTEDGKISCLIDWGGIEAVLIQGGYAHYPSWITRDWDPLMYAYPDPSPGMLLCRSPFRVFLIGN